MSKDTVADFCHIAAYMGASSMRLVKGAFDTVIREAAQDLADRIIAEDDIETQISFLLENGWNKEMIIDIINCLSDHYRKPCIPESTTPHRPLEMK